MDESIKDQMKTQFQEIKSQIKAKIHDAKKEIIKEVKINKGNQIFLDNQNVP